MLSFTALLRLSVPAGVAIGIIIVLAVALIIFWLYIWHWIERNHLRTVSKKEFEYAQRFVGEKILASIDDSSIGFFCVGCLATFIASGKQQKLFFSKKHAQYSLLRNPANIGRLFSIQRQSREVADLPNRYHLQTSDFLSLSL